MQAIIAERNDWESRKASANRQIETVASRQAELVRERAELDDAPALFLQKRRALISEVETAEQGRQMAANALQAAENMMRDTDREARTSIEFLSQAREACARSEERMESGKRRLEDIEREIRDMLEVEPEGVGALAEVRAEDKLPDLHDVEAELEKMRRDRERLGAVNLRAEEELG